MIALTINSEELTLFSYGGRGWGIVVRFINLLMPEVGERSEANLDLFTRMDLFIDTFLLPEATSVVLAKEYTCSIQDGFHLMCMSEPFGLKEHPLDNSCPVLKRVQEATDINDLRRQYEMGEEAFMRAPAKRAGPTYVSIPVRLLIAVDL